MQNLGMYENREAVKRLFIKTYGCQMNEYDSSRINDLLHSHFNIVSTNDYEQADIIILNTCSIREKAQEKVFHELGRFKNLKKENTNLIICVGGCVASQEGKNIIKRAPFVDVIFGPQTLHRLPKLIKKNYETKKYQVDVSFPELEKFEFLPIPNTKNAKAFVSIMEGCNKYCSYCIVPYTRGPEVHRPFDDIIGECALLAEKQIKEITLLGQNVNNYAGKISHNKVGDLSMLINVIAEINGIERIRFITSHPNNFSTNLINTYANVSKLASHLHLPIQHASKNILTQMKRTFNLVELKEKMIKLRDIRPNVSITSDFIIGFPGETEDDFQKLLTFIKEINFDKSYSFIYSKRPGTTAEKLHDNTGIEIKKQRLLRIQKLLDQNAMLSSRKMLNTVQRVLIEGKSKKNKHMLIGKTDNNRIVKILGNDDLIGKFMNIRIKDTSLHSLHGEVDCIKSVK